MNENKKELWFVIIISGIIGLIVGFIDISAEFIKIEQFRTLALDTTIGIIIGLVSRNWFIYLYTRKKLNGKLIFVLVFFTIGLISSIPSLFDYIFMGELFYSTEYLLIVISAEVLGLSFSYFMYKNILKINNKLEMKKQEIERKSIGLSEQLAVKVEKSQH
jgi:hypothetical protein